jgi:hypothetical protein
MKTFLKTRNCLKAALMLSAVTAAPAAWAQTTITLPLFGTVDAVIDWGAEGANATCTRAVTAPGEVSCTYPAEDGAGPFQVRVSGTVTQFGNGDAGYANADKITRVTRFGNVGLTSLSGAFNGAERLMDVPADIPETVTDLSFAFKGAVLFNDPDVRDWGMKTRNVTNMTGTFEDALDFNQELDTWCMRQVSAPPARFRTLQMTQTRFDEIRGRLQSRGFSVGGLTREIKLTEAKEPKWGQCGVTIDASAPPAAETGAAFSMDLRARAQLWANAPAEANVNSLTFEVASGTLPPGVTLNGATGVLSGTPSTPGTYHFTIRAVQN